MKEVPLSAEVRKGVGKGPARQDRFAGNIPAVLYGPDTAPQPISINARAFRQAVKSADGTSAIFNLEVGGKSNMTIIREMQRDPVTSSIMHIDFHAISMNKPLHLSIPLHFVGTPSGVKTEGGIMQTTMRELEISCLPKDIPEHFEIDVSALNIGDSIHVGSLSIPNVEILSEKTRTMVVVSAPTIIKVAEPEVVEGAEALAEGAEGEEAAEAAEGEGAEKEEKKEKKEKKEE
jgi:large subunit ribosomal protein L25